MGWSKKPASYEDIEALPAGWVGEIVEDELMASPRPAMGHGYAASALGALLMAPFSWGRGGPGGWCIIREPELHFGRDVLVPDLAGWRCERMPRPFSAEEPFTTLAPDWVCEVLSPSTATFDRERKLPRYHREGVTHAWLIEPLVRRLTVLRRGAARWRRIALRVGARKVRAEPFDAVTLELERLWLPEFSVNSPHTTHRHQ